MTSILQGLESKSQHPSVVNFHRPHLLSLDLIPNILITICNHILISCMDFPSSVLPQSDHVISRSRPRILYCSTTCKHKPLLLKHILNSHSIMQHHSISISPRDAYLLDLSQRAGQARPDDETITVKSLPDLTRSGLPVSLRAIRPQFLDVIQILQML